MTASNRSTSGRSDDRQILRIPRGAWRNRAFVKYALRTGVQQYLRPKSTLFTLMNIETIQCTRHYLYVRSIYAYGICHIIMIIYFYTRINYVIMNHPVLRAFFFRVKEHPLYLHFVKSCSNVFLMTSSIINSQSVQVTHTNQTTHSRLVQDVKCLDIFIIAKFQPVIYAYTII